MRVRITRNTQGPKCWYASHVGEVFDVSPYYLNGINTGDWVGDDLDGSGSACLIAAEDCEELDGPRAADPAEDLVFVPGEFHCPACSFRLHARVMRASDGAVGVDASAEPEPCPNGCGRLERLTWKRDAEDANRVALALMKELRAARARLDELEPAH